MFAEDSTVYISGASNFMYNSTQLNGGGVYASTDALMYIISGSSNYMNNSAQEGGGVFAQYATVYVSGESNFMNNSVL